MPNPVISRADFWKAIETLAAERIANMDCTYTMFDAETSTDPLLAGDGFGLLVSANDNQTTVSAWLEQNNAGQWHVAFTATSDVTLSLDDTQRIGAAYVLIIVEGIIWSAHPPLTAHPE